MSTHVLAGSIREPLAGARLAGKANPAERLEVTVLVRRQSADAFKANEGGWEHQTKLIAKYLAAPAGHAA